MRAACSIIALAGLLLRFAPLRAQQPADSSGRARPLFAGVPLVFYTPETRWGFGASGVCILNWKNDTVNARPSTVSLAFAFTQNRQMFAVMPYHLFFRNARWQLYGEIAYNRYRYNFFGTGNEVPPNYVERYGIEFPRLRVTALYRLAGGFYAGPRYAFDRISLFGTDPNGLFARKQVQGWEGGTVSGPAVVLMFDKRDNIYYPRKGIWTELVWFRNLVAGDGFTRMAFDFSGYIPVGEKNIFALNAYSIYSPDQLPFYQMGLLGGIKKMRGFYEGRYRDNNLILFQGEYRRWVFGPLGCTVFASLGQVASSYRRFDYDYWRFTYGAGLRLRVDRKRKVNLRADLAVGNGKILTYFTVGEAF